MVAVMPMIRPKVAAIPTARLAGTLRFTKWGTKSVPPPIPTKPEMMAKMKPILCENGIANFVVLAYSFFFGHDLKCRKKGVDDKEIFNKIDSQFG